MGVTLSLEEQIKRLDSCGFVCPEALSLDRLLSEWDRQDYESTPFSLLLGMYGADDESAGYHGVWYCDSERIENPGDYTLVVEVLCRLTRGELPIVNISDGLDEAKNRAWVSFEIDAKRVLVDLVIDGDWMDWSIVTKLDALLSARGSALRFAEFVTGQSSLVTCITPERKRLIELCTGLEWCWSSP